jgi:hypothetical protein
MMEYVRRFKNAASVVITSSLVLAGCTGGSSNTTPTADQGTALPASGEDAGPPGRLRISAVKVSSGLESAAFAIDHELQLLWSSGMFAPGWIQLDLGQPTTISRVRLYTAQYPAGPTSHQIEGGLTPGSLAPLGTLDGDTADEQWLELRTNAQVRYVKVVTVKSPSWVGWRELEVYE